MARATAFGTRTRLAPGPSTGVLINTPVFTVRAFHMDHLTPSLAYLVEEKPRLNINTAELAARGLPGGSWLQRLKDEALGNEVGLELQGVSYKLGDLREGLLERSPGASVAYLTDFLLDEEAMERLSRALKGCTTIVCEAQFQHADVGLALKTHHMTTVQAATLAERAGAGGACAHSPVRTLPASRVGERATGGSSGLPKHALPAALADSSSTWRVSQSISNAFAGRLANIVCQTV